MQDLVPEPTRGQINAAQLKKQLAEIAARKSMDRATSGAMWAVSGLCFLISNVIITSVQFGGIYGLATAFASVGVWMLITAIVLGRRA